MGFISNQWLNRGQGVRTKSYHPVPVRISCEKSTTAWSHRNGAKVEFIARKPDWQYQILHLTQEDADNVAATVVSAMTQEQRDKLAANLALRMSQDARVALLADLLSGLDLKRRVRPAARDKLLSELLGGVAADLRKPRRQSRHS